VIGRSRSRATTVATISTGRSHGARHLRHATTISGRSNAATIAGRSRATTIAGHSHATRIAGRSHATTIAGPATTAGSSHATAIADSRSAATADRSNPTPARHSLDARTAKQERVRGHRNAARARTTRARVHQLRRATTVPARAAQPSRCRRHGHLVRASIRDRRHPLVVIVVVPSDVREHRRWNVRDPTFHPAASTLARFAGERSLDRSASSNDARTRSPAPPRNDRPRSSGPAFSVPRGRHRACRHIGSDERPLP
jgi:hypothetical protein